MKSFECDRSATVNLIVDNVKKEFPTLTSEDRKEFMVKSKQFIETMVQSKNIDTLLLQSIKKEKCEKCSTEYVNWGHKAKNALFLDVAELKLINIPVKMCPTCKYLVYPNVLEYGLFCIHNKVLLSYRLLMELCDQMFIGGSLIDFISAKVHNNGLSEGLDYDFLSINLVNIAKMVEGCGIALLSLLIQKDDMNMVVCLYCGNCPKCVNSDGNSKDTVAIDPSYMVYEKEGELCLGHTISVKNTNRQTLQLLD